MLRDECVCKKINNNNDAFNGVVNGKFVIYFYNKFYSFTQISNAMNFHKFLNQPNRSNIFYCHEKLSAVKQFSTEF